MIFFKGQKAVPWTRANRDVADQDLSDLRSSVQDAEFRRWRALTLLHSGYSGREARALGSARRCHRADAPCEKGDRVRARL
jgi:hypothetical protein